MIRPEFQKAQQEFQQAQDELKEAREERISEPRKKRRATAAAACTPSSRASREEGFQFPGRPLRENATYVSTDGNKWCTFSNGSATVVVLVPADDNGQPIAYRADTPGSVQDVSTPGTPGGGDGGIPTSRTNTHPPRRSAAARRNPITDDA